jgi:hypothetical protein
MQWAGGALLAAALALVVFRPELTDPLRAVLSVTMMGAALVVACLYYRALDEAAREAHKAAWYWGGSIGLLCAAVASALVMNLGLELPSSLLPQADTRPHALVGLGILIAMVFQLAGYTIAWIWWWAVRR